MVMRSGLGATLAASVVFSVILVSGVAVYVASQGSAALGSVADSEDSLKDGYYVLAGAGATNILTVVQEFLSSNTLPCQSAAAAAAREVGSLVDVQRAGNMTVTASASLVDSGPVYDNFTIMKPFGGSAPGTVDIAVRFAGQGEGAPGVAFNRTETHYVHLGVRLAAESAACEQAAAGFAALVRGSLAPNCSSTSVSPVVQGAADGAGSIAEAGGFASGLTYSIGGNGSCTIEYTLWIQQSGVSGPAGPFNVRLEESGSALLPTSA
jgi:hypothetical protein